MKQDYTHITVVLDRSGSMEAVRSDTIHGFNRFLETHQKAPGQCTLTLVKFDDLYEVECHARPVGEVPPLDNARFEPRGATALLGAIGKAIDDTGKALKARPEADRPGKVLFVIITDGQENASYRCPWANCKTKAQVGAKIRHQTDMYKWEFVYIGANQDAIAEARDIGVDASNAMDYTANAAGTQALYASVASNSVKYRSGETRCCTFSDEDRAAQEAAR